MAKPLPPRCAVGQAERGGRLARVPGVAMALPEHKPQLYRWRRLTAGARPKVTGPDGPRGGGERRGESAKGRQAEACGALSNQGAPSLVRGRGRLPRPQRL